MSTTDPPPRGALRRAVAVITRVELAIATIALLLIFSLVLLQAVQRYLPVDGFAWTGEIAKFSLIWLTFSVAGVLVTTHGHIALEVVDTLPKPRLVRSVQVFSLAVVCVVAILLTVEAWNLIQTQSALRSPALRMPMSWVYVPVLVGVASTAVRAGAATIDIALHGPILPTVADENEVHAL